MGRWYSGRDDSGVPIGDGWNLVADMEDTMNGRGLKIGNEYADAFGRMYADTPKAVFAAVAYSLAMRLNGDQHEAAIAEFVNEWRVLHANGIVSQGEPKKNA